MNIPKKIPKLIQNDNSMHINNYNEFIEAYNNGAKFAIYISDTIYTDTILIFTSNINIVKKVIQLDLFPVTNSIIWKRIDTLFQQSVHGVKEAENIFHNNMEIMEYLLSRYEYDSSNLSYLEVALAHKLNRYNVGLYSDVLILLSRYTKLSLHPLVNFIYNNWPYIEIEKLTILCGYLDTVPQVIYKHIRSNIKPKLSPYRHGHYKPDMSIVFENNT